MSDETPATLGERHIVTTGQLYGLMYDAWKEAHSPTDSKNDGGKRWDVGRTHLYVNEVTDARCGAEPESWKVGGLIVACALHAGHEGKHASVVEWSW